MKKTPKRNSGAFDRERWTVLCIVLLACAARMAFLSLTGYYGNVINGDAYEYNTITSSLMSGYGYAFDLGEPTAFRPFGYPFFLGGVYTILGQSTIAVHWVQTLVGGLLVLPTYGLTRHLGDHRIAILASVGVALHPILVYLTAILAPETLTVFLQMCLLYFAFRLVECEHLSFSDLAGFTITGVGAVLMRSELMLLIWLLPIMYAFTTRLVLPMHYRIRTIFVVTLVTTGLAIVPTTIRNWVVLDAPTPFPTIGGVTFWGANNGASDGGWILPSPEVWPDDSPPSSMRGWSGLSEVESQHRFYQTSFVWMREHPMEIPPLLVRKLERSWMLSYADQDRQVEFPPPVSILNLCFGGCAILGLLLLLHRRSSILWLFLATVFSWIAKTLVFYGSARQSATVFPIACILAAVTLVWLANGVVFLRQRYKEV